MVMVEGRIPWATSLLMPIYRCVFRHRHTGLRALHGYTVEWSLCLCGRPTFSSQESHMSDVTSPRNIAAALVEFWSPRVIGEVNDTCIKVAKLHGSLAWHSHDDEDELFLVLKGHLRIELDDGNVELGEGEMFIVPKGVRHNPVAEAECQIMLIERKSTRHTGDIITDRTRSLAEQLRPL